MAAGTIIKGYSGFYYVDVKGKIIECSLRGKNRLSKSDFYPGDHVEIRILNEEKGVGVIEKTLSRKNFLVRPPVANVDQLIITSALKEPAPDFMLIDRLMAIAFSKGIKPVLIFNKTDLVSKEELEEIRNIYAETGVQLLFITTLEENDLELLREILKELFQDKISSVAGISGVGKTSIVNIVKAGAELKVGEISEKLKRGKHTTRHTELIKIEDNSWIADSPGFSSLDFPKDFQTEQLPKVYPEFRKYDQKCKFKNCFHLEEPDCEVKRQLEINKISRIRYENYKYFLEELRKREGSQY